jgi:dihydrofolate reductase
MVSLHTTLDGFLAGPQGEMNWIKLDAELFDLVGTFTDNADTALYGRVTYDMMDSYWPTAGDGPEASKHDRHHSAWYNRVNKVVLSRTLQGTEKEKTRFINGDAPRQLEQLKQQEGKNILVFGSPSLVRLLIEHKLVDDYWLFVNPVILGEGIPLFPATKQRIQLQLAEQKAFNSGVVGLHYVA